VDCDATPRVTPGITGCDPLASAARQMLQCPIECSTLWQTCAANIPSPVQLTRRRSQIRVLSSPPLLSIQRAPSIPASRDSCEVSKCFTYFFAPSPVTGGPPLATRTSETGYALPRRLALGVPGGSCCTEGKWNRSYYIHGSQRNTRDSIWLPRGRTASIKKPV
jgi:hypothetical protein